MLPYLLKVKNLSIKNLFQHYLQVRKKLDQIVMTKELFQVSSWTIFFFLFYTHTHIFFSEGTHYVIVIVQGNCLNKPSSNLNKAVCISICTNAFGKGMNPSFLPPAMDK